MHPTSPPNLVLTELIKESAYKTGSSIHYGQYFDKEAVIKIGGQEVEREAAILSEVRSAKIPSVLDMLPQGDQKYLVMERLYGASLDDYINLKITEETWTNRRINEEEAMAITLGIAGCFLELRQHGYLYRDLNLNHVLLAENDTYLVDHEWDVKLDTDDTATVDSLSGTWETMAPEEFTIGNKMTEASNTYTLGVVLLQLISGQNPYRAPELPEMDGPQKREAAVALHSKIPPLEKVSSEIAAILQIALQPDTDKRYQTIADFIAAVHSTYYSS